MDRTDDPTVSGDMVLLRRIPPKGDRVQWDADGKPTPSSQNFKDKDNELSTYIAAEATEEQVLAGHEGFGLVRITAGKVRELLGTTFILCRDTSDPIPGHVLVCGNFTDGIAKKLKKAADWVPGRWPARIPPEAW
jgi:hypothetical protein